MAPQAAMGGGGVECNGWDGIGDRALRLEQMDRLWKQTIGKLHILEVATWENFLRKLSLGKTPLGNYLTSLTLKMAEME